jgi:hypothetical protein
MSRRLIWALGVLLVFAAGSCESRVHRPPDGGDTTLVEVDYSTAWPTVDSRWQLPVFVLFGDGSAIVRSANRGVLRTATRRRYSTQQVTEVFRRAERAGLFGSRQYRSDVNDASVLIVRMASTDGRYETTLAQPDPQEGGVRGRVAAFAQDVPKLGEPAGEYRPQRLAVLVVRSSDGSDRSATDVRPWPLSTPLSAMPNGCLLIEGADLSAVPALGADVTSRTRWDAGGQRVALVVRPLLPGERGCADVTRRQ